MIRKGLTRYIACQTFFVYVYLLYGLVAMVKVYEQKKPQPEHLVAAFSISFGMIISPVCLRR